MMQQSPLRIMLLMQGGVEWIGGLQYIENLVLAIGTSREPTGRKVEIDLLTSRSSPQLSPAASRYVHRTYFAEDELPRYSVPRRIWRKFRRDVLGHRQGIYDALFARSGADFVYPYLTPAPRPGGVRSAAWIYDFQHKALPQYFSAEETRRRDSHFASIAKTDATMVVSSKCAEQDFHRWFPNAVARPRVVNFYLVPDERWYAETPGPVLARYNLPERFILVCNQFWKHKNHLLVLRALHELKRAGRRVPVVCTGHLYDDRDPRYASEVLQSIHTLGLADQVYLLGLVPRAEQIQLIRQSVGLVQPSLFEGWSSVVEDGRCLGKTMLLSDIGVHREQNPPGAAYFDPASAEQLAARIGALWLENEPGPHTQAENAALTRQRQHVRSYADTFLSVASGE